MGEKLHSWIQIPYLPLFLFLLALTARMALLVATFPGNDKIEYFEDVKIATSLIEGRGFETDYSGLRVINTFFGTPAGVDLDNIGSRPTAIKLPTYPLLVAGVFHLFGSKNLFALFLANAFLAAATSPLLFFLGRSMRPGVGAISGFAFAIYPPFVYHSVRVPESTSLLLFLLCAFLLLLVGYQHSRTTRRLVACATTGAVIALTEAVAIPLVVVGLIYACWAPSSRGVAASPTTADSPQRARKLLAHLTLAGAIVALAVVPWTCRNYRVFGEFPVLRSGIGTNLLLTLRRAELLPDDVVVGIAAQVPGTNELEEEAVIQKEVTAWIEDHPAAYWSATMTNFIDYSWETVKYRGNKSLRYLAGRRLPYLLLLLLSLPAIFGHLSLLLRDPRHSMRSNFLPNMALLLLFSFTAVYTLFGAHNLRYHFPVELMMLIFASETLLNLLPSPRPGAV